MSRRSMLYVKGQARPGVAAACILPALRPGMLSGQTHSPDPIKSRGNVPRSPDDRDVTSPGSIVARECPLVPAQAARASVYSVLS